MPDEDPIGNLIVLSMAMMFQLYGTKDLIQKNR